MLSTIQKRRKEEKGYPNRGKKEKLRIDKRRQTVEQE